MNYFLHITAGNQRNWVVVSENHYAYVWENEWTGYERDTLRDTKNTSVALTGLQDFFIYTKRLYFPFVAINSVCCTQCYQVIIRERWKCKMFVSLIWVISISTWKSKQCLQLQDAGLRRTSWKFHILNRQYTHFPYKRVILQINVILSLVYVIHAPLRIFFFSVGSCMYNATERISAPPTGCENPTSCSLCVKRLLYTSPIVFSYLLKLLTKAVV